MSQQTLAELWYGPPAVPPIPGLAYHPDYLAAPSADALLADIDAQPWRHTWRRRTQQYGIGYGAGAARSRPERLGDLPGWIAPLARRLVDDGLFPRLPENMVINDYQPGQGVAPHVDHAPFGPTVLAISLGSACVMDFRTGDGRHESVLLEPRSLLVIGGEARSAWTHGIASRLADRWQGIRMARGRRVSVTFRLLGGAAP